MFKIFVNGGRVGKRAAKEIIAVLSIFKSAFGETT